ncbi:protein containing DUF37 [Candidatus Omnitrophus magneticus]|uniref:Putative membrane protein insertion efficiency factor n=1 Tax=Candidatus Omnitrophus magneticus TaxID=1609969 RepID=A0A0F0CR81_9BACT|nr:protein containing DUF37 [Candidatus Omnitrophus magneticus]
MLKKIIIKTLDFYKNLISPYLPRSCRFYPTCSSYTKEAVIEYGVLEGVWKGIKRISKCNPCCQGGYDPITKEKE